jgi:hypothetical protein
VGAILLRQALEEAHQDGIRTLGQSVRVRRCEAILHACDGAFL